MKLWSFIKKRMLLHFSQEICENEAKLSYEETVAWAETFAKKLRGIHCCAILCSSEMAASMALLSCFAAEVTAVPLSMRYGQAHCDKILDTISPDAIIMDTSNELMVYRIKDSHYKTPSDHPALIMCTSGTTGKPKGAMLSEKNIKTNIRDIADYFAINENDTILIARPLYHCAVLTGEFLTALIKGAKIRFSSEAFNPTGILNMIEQYKITTFCGTPTLLSMISTFKRNRKLETLKYICISGECMSSEVGIKIREAFASANIYHIYGLTEACPRVSYLPPKYFVKYPDCVGVPLKSVSIKLLNRSGNQCDKNEEGILWVKGNNIMLGYYEDSEKTSEAIKDGWLCTGDIAIINSAGFLKIKGRSDDLIIKAGMNIYPAEIEGILKESPLVKEVLVYGIPSNSGTKIGLKIVGAFASTEEVRKLCVELLPPFQVPTVIQLLEELPKSGSGKIIRRFCE